MLPSVWIQGTALRLCKRPDYSLMSKGRMHLRGSMRSAQPNPQPTVDACDSEWVHRCTTKGSEISLSLESVQTNLSSRFSADDYCFVGHVLIVRYLFASIYLQLLCLLSLRVW